MRRLARWLAALALARRRRGRAPAAGAAETHEPPAPARREVGAGAGAQLVVLAALAVTVLAAAGFAVLYVVEPDTQLLGLCAALAAAGLSVALGVAGKRVVPQEVRGSEYHSFGDPGAREEVAGIVAGAGEGVSRRRLLLGAAGAAGASAAAAAAVPLASLGPGVGRRLAVTPWSAGVAVVGEDGTPVRADDVREGQLLLGLPAGADPRRRLTDAVNLLRFGAGELALPADRLAACPGGIVAYSRICTHAGCAVSMYRRPLFAANHPGPALVCPCHYSTFDPRRGGAVEFGPAARPLPQLPLRVNAAGELEAAGGFYDTPGPSYGDVRLQRGEDR